jgi:prepilin-type N-terminal cleavage/methylation domain-containing protein
MREHVVEYAMKFKCRESRCAFTLVELLVVVGIIGLLISILLPVLGSARTAAIDLKCVSNVKQISTALRLYATQAKGYLPPMQETTAIDSATWHARIWSQTIGRPFPNDQFRGDGTYSYLKRTVFECPQAELSKRGGYDSNDYRKNGYAMNNGIPGTAGNINPALSLSVNVTLRMLEHKMLYKVRSPSQTMLLTDSRLFYVDYYDRGATMLQMDVLANPNAGGMIDALGRHGKKRDQWSIAFCDGSVRSLAFKDVPGTPAQYYLVANRMTPPKLVAATDVSGETKFFWTGRDK